jgi:transposase
MDDQSDDLRRVAPLRMEVFAGTGRKRWPDAVKAQIVVESFVEGAVVTDVARRHGCRAQQIHDWRGLARRGALELPDGARIPPTMMRQSRSARSPDFAPLVMTPAPPPAVADDCVIEVAGATIRVRGRAVGSNRPIATAVAEF